MTDEEIEKAVKSLKWVENQILRNLADNNYEKILSCIKLYCENAEEAIKCLKEESEKLRKRLQISPYGDDKIDELELAVKFLQIDKEQVRKNTAKEILQWVNNKMTEGYGSSIWAEISKGELRDKAEEYGVEVDDE